MKPLDLRRSASFPQSALYSSPCQTLVAAECAAIGYFVSLFLASFIQMLTHSLLDRPLNPVLGEYVYFDPILSLIIDIRLAAPIQNDQVVLRLLAGR
jgi:hypothetical protein